MRFRSRKCTFRIRNDRRDVRVHRARPNDGDPLALASAIRSLFARIDPTLVLDEVMTLEQALAETIAPRRLNLFLLGTFAASALALALIGMYGLMTHWVTQRRQEIGVRMALGAQRREVVRMVVRKGWALRWPELAPAWSALSH